MEKRTDLALEVRESFPEDDVEISGVSLQEENFQEQCLRLTRVKILNEEGSRQMGKPQGEYITMELQEHKEIMSRQKKQSLREFTAEKLAEILEEMTRNYCRERKMEGGGKAATGDSVILLAGLGNRFATPDALGPFVLENIPVNRHLLQEFGVTALSEGERILCGVAPGVMGQTGMETREILKGIIENVKPVCVFVVDALASRSVNRLCRTIQITDTGICPGAGIGNNRNALNKETLSVPVIAIGVPTVVDAGTIVAECMEESLQAQGYQEKEIQLFIQSLRRTENLFVTPKDIDEQLRDIGDMISQGIRRFARLS